ncbi:MAG TPA: prenyltransferase/squalene oxidase repeat-containing protein [Acidimicrobiales bacterium]|nr:prenyltransferase/squalene oxidase repeat-containing protein [Acidimicrobiales bacterium]
MSRRPSAVIGIVLGALALALFAPASLPVPAIRPAGAATASLDLARAAAFLRANQQPDGGFETAGFPGFETPDAVLALAEAAQATSSWNTASGRAAVAAAVHDGRSPLDYVDDLAETTTSAGQAAKLIVLVAAPLGLPPATFDPQGDAATDLVARMDAGRNVNGSFGPPGTLNATLYAAIAHPLIGRSVPPATQSLILAAQQANGGWSFSGDATGGEIDVDTTGLALQALAAAGVDPHTSAVRRAVAFLASNQLATGGWPAFDAEDPNATAVAVLGLTAVGEKVDTCWPGAGGVLAARQAADGHVAGPNDAFGVNTFATSQAVQAAGRRWLPVSRRPAYCPDDGYRLVAADGGVFAVRAPYFGSMGGVRVNRPMVWMATTPGGQGYWLVASDGGVFAFGDAHFAGSTGGLPLNQPIVGMAATPSGGGYWLVARDGGVFAFGDARYLGSTGALTLNKPVTGIGPTPSGRGYWLVAADGGVFAFGDARFLGSSAPTGALTSVVGIRAGRRADGYVYADAEGRAVSQGAGSSAPSERLPLNAPIVGISG